MSFWIVFWQIFFVIVLIGFAGMAVWVTISGFRDIRKLFRHLDQVHGEKKE